ncbi:protein of unknown function [Tenacibaculum aestuariivivum]
MLAKIFLAGKRILSGENLFMTVFTNKGLGKNKFHLLHLIRGRLLL